MRSIVLASITALTVLVLWTGVARSHCEIPCGIYGDKTRIDLLFEHITTIEKSMTEITALAGKTDPQSMNQLVRWIENKDQHATEIQHVATQYFMTQRIKPKAAGDDARDKYLAQLTAMHEILVSAMKCKQTVDAQHCAALRAQVDAFSAAYFSAEDLEHIREHHKEH